MTTATAVILATGMVCSTALFIVFMVFRQARHLVKDVLDQVKVQGRSVSVNIDKKITVDVGEDE